MNKIQKLMPRLRELASREPMEHDDLFGENPDDAYDYGFRDGKASLALEILDALKESEKQ